jgi:hypothetical protein
VREIGKERERKREGEVERERERGRKRKKEREGETNQESMVRPTLEGRRCMLGNNMKVWKKTRTIKLIHSFQLVQHLHRRPW